MVRYLRVNLLGPGPRLIKKNLPGRGLTKVEKHCSKTFPDILLTVVAVAFVIHIKCHTCLVLYC